MTKYTNRDNIKPMFFIVVGMMIMFCLFTTRTFESFCRWHFVGSDSMVYYALGFSFLCVASCVFLFSCFENLGLLIYLLVLFLVFFISNRLSLFFSYKQSFFALFIFFTAYSSAVLTFSLKPIFCVTVLVKFRKWFDLFASRTLFHYNHFSHFCFSSKRNWLEPICWYTPAVGLSYHNRQINLFNKKVRLF